MKYFTRARTSPPEDTAKDIKEILTLVQPQLRKVDEAIQVQAGKFDDAISGYVAYALESTGKRLRPALALLVGGATCRDVGEAAASAGITLHGLALEAASLEQAFMALTHDASEFATADEKVSR